MCVGSRRIQIIFKENFGADDQNRTQYFDNQGILRDVVQNHLLQVRQLSGGLHQLTRPLRET